MDNHLHIVCLDVPFPPDYGGVFDLFYKIKSLHELGIKIHLHCFEYGRGQQPQLNQYCEEVIYYKRNSSLKNFLRLPFIVSSRINEQLIQNLLKDKYSVLLEGIHCTYYLYNNQLQNRKVIVRLHNVEYEYYQQLSHSTKNILKKIWFYIESKSLEKYEEQIANKALFLTVNEKDTITYQKIFFAEEIEFLPVFLPFEKVNSLIGKGSYCLYHGNLSVSENEKAVVWLLENVFNNLAVDCIIAGKNPSINLQKICKANKNVQLIANPSEEKMKELISEAHIHLLPSFNKTGIKIKLLNALFNGRFIIANSRSIDGTGFNSLCKIEESGEDFKKLIVELMNTEFTEADKLHRVNMLEEQYNNHANAQQLMNYFQATNW